MMNVGIIDYGVGNLGSLARAFELLGVKPVLLDSPSCLREVDCLVLPGVGNYSEGARLLYSAGWTAAVGHEVIGRDKGLLGICLGMQLLGNSSTEGSDDERLPVGLGLIPGEVKHLREFGCTSRVPHAGWNAVEVVSRNESLFESIPIGSDFYFVHSFAFHAHDRAHVIAVTRYGVELTAAIRRGKVWGTQFHPEKSSKAGLLVLKNFIESIKC